MPTRDDVHESVREHDGLLKPSAISLTEALTSKGASVCRSLKNKEAPTLSASNRRSLSDVGEYLLSPGTRLGIDYVEVAFNFRDFIMDNPKDWEKGPREVTVQKNYGKWTNSFPLNPAFPKADLYFQAEVSQSFRRGKLWFNPSTVLFGPKSLYLATVEDTLVLLGYAYTTIGKWLQVSQPLESFTLQRLDVSCDVDRVADVQRLLKATVNFPHNSKVSVTPYCKGASQYESVVARSKRNGGFIVYDKSRQCKKGDAVVRFEAGARRSVLKQHCSTVADLTETTASHIFRHFFQKMMTGLSQTTETPLEGLLCDAKYKKRLVELVGIKTLKRCGYHVTSGSTQEKGYRELERMGSGNAIEALLDKLGK